MNNVWPDVGRTAPKHVRAVLCKS